MMQALGIIADKAAKDMTEMVAGVDYEDVILSYDWRLHRSKGESKGHMDGSGRLYVIRIKPK